MSYSYVDSNKKRWNKSQSSWYQMIENFAFITNLVFLIFLSNIDIEVFWKVSAKNKIVVNENWTHNTNYHWIKFLMPYQPSLLASLRFSDPHIKSCSIESTYDPKFSSRIFYSTHVWVAESSRHLPSNPLMVGVVSSIPTGGNVIFCWKF